MIKYKDLLQILYQNYTKNKVSRSIGILSLLFILSGCQTILSPEQATATFWEAMANGELESARKYTTSETQYLVIKQENLIGASLETGVIVINGPNAKVATVIALKDHENNKNLAFDTVLLKENNVWKVDYRQTLNNLSILPFGEVINSLRGIGDFINK